LHQIFVLANEPTVAMPQNAMPSGLDGVDLVGRGLLVLIVAWPVYHLLKALYNISPLHPLSKIPGPKLAAATYLPEFYHDVVLNGRYTHAIKQMHEKYGR
jgi:hypothetical protein